MRVICIDASPWKANPNIKQPLIEGKEYNVSVHPRGGYIVPGVTPMYVGKFTIVSIDEHRFVPLTGDESEDLSHAEPIESTLILKEV